MRAVRAGVWFRTLPRIDRALLDLSIKVAKSICSVTLAKSISAITSKLENSLRDSLSRTLKDQAVQLAQKVSAIAQKWGNVTAIRWGSDESFIRFLIIMNFNKPTTPRG
jgi:hypothetical protein